jgi:tRNA modification GTPase
MHRSAERNSPETSTGLTTGESSIIAGDTIAAISTPVGEGAIALVRVSGADAIAVADKVFRGKEKPSRFAPHVQHFGEIFDAAGQLIDQVMLSIHRAPSSYTGEDLIEISCHGGMLVSARVMAACLCAGGRGARPGEFTGAHSSTVKWTRRLRRWDVRGAISRFVPRLSSGGSRREVKTAATLVSLTAHIDASIDFPGKCQMKLKIGRKLDSVREEMTALLATQSRAHSARGVRVAIYGATNAGKSSCSIDFGYER